MPTVHSLPGKVESGNALGLSCHGGKVGLIGTDPPLGFEVSQKVVVLFPDKLTPLNPRVIVVNLAEGTVKITTLPSHIVSGPLQLAPPQWNIDKKLQFLRRQPPQVVGHSPAIISLGKPGKTISQALLSPRNQLGTNLAVRPKSRSSLIINHSEGQHERTISLRFFGVGSAQLGQSH